MARIFNHLILNFFFFLSITIGAWSKHDDSIGNLDLPEGVKPEDFVGAEKETRYASIQASWEIVNSGVSQIRLHSRFTVISCQNRPSSRPICVMKLLISKHTMTIASF